MPAHWLIRYYWGFLLPSICDAWGLDHEACDSLHEAFKQVFEIQSTTFLDENDFLSYIDSIHGLLVTEFGIMVPHINEPPNVDEITMEQFLSLYK
jgi:hypothetical protein